MDTATEYSQGLAHVFNSRAWYELPIEDRIALRDLFMAHDTMDTLSTNMRAIYDQCVTSPAYYGAP